MIAEAEGLSAKTEQKKQRAFLRCNERFLSYHAGHRICERCKPVLNREASGLNEVDVA
jgi:hypothetical protein